LTNPELAKMAQQITQATHQASKTFGPWGGAQTGQALGQARGQQPVLATFLNPTVKGGLDRASFMRGASLIAPQGQVRRETKTAAPDLDALAKQIAELGPGARAAYNWWNTPGATSTSAEAQAALNRLRTGGYYDPEPGLGAYKPFEPGYGEFQRSGL
jgi:hypothetical protein